MPCCPVLLSLYCIVIFFERNIWRWRCSAVAAASDVDEADHDGHVTERWRHRRSVAQRRSAEAHYDLVTFKNGGLTPTFFSIFGTIDANM